MPYLFQSFYVSQKKYWHFTSLLVLYLGVFLLNQMTENSFLSLLQLISGTFFFLFGAGASFTVILQWLLKKEFNLLEFLSLSILFSFLVPPFLLNLEFSLFKQASVWHPLINIFILVIPAGLLLFFKKTILPSFQLTTSYSFLRSHPLFLTFILGTLFILLQILSFSPLPDLDPYKWLFKYTYQFENNLLDHTERPLFGALIFNATTLMGITIFGFFKYFLPFLILTTLIPAWLIARTFTDQRKQWLFLLFILSTPNIVLYAGTAMPQVPLILITYFFVFFLLYSHLKQDDFFLYIAGLSVLIGFFYHETALLILPAWILPILITKRGMLLAHKKTLFLITIPLLFSLPYLRPLYDFGARWIARIIPAFLEKAHFNWSYPAQYSNIDRNLMGWDSWSGIIKFYAYYIGPVLGGILFIFLILFSYKKFRVFLFEKLQQPGLAIIFLSFLIFFIIAEVFPRFPGLALLPDRAWVFAGIFGYLFLFLLLEYIPQLSLRKFSLFLLLFFVAISGTLYINFLKRYLISPLQLESTEWIQASLPENRLFLSYGYRSLLPVHANSPVVNIPNELYCQSDFQNFEQVLSQFEATKRILTVAPLATIPHLSSPISNRYIYTLTPVTSLKGRPLYIYYSQVHTKNPYRNRPYSMKSWGIQPCPEGKFLFDQFPQKFERVYQAKDAFDEVIIWKVL
jgi:hypothetical protein